jgi:O-antigen ligase
MPDTYKKKVEFLSFVLTAMFVISPFIMFVANVATRAQNQAVNILPTASFLFVMGFFCVGLAALRLIVFLVGDDKKRIAIDFCKDNIAFLIFCGFLLLAVISTIVNWPAVSAVLEPISSAQPDTGYMLIETRTPDQIVRDTLFGTDYRMEGILTYIIYIFVFFTASTIKNNNYKRILIYTAVFISGLLAFLTAMVDGGLTDNAAYGVFSKVAVFVNFNHYGYYLAVTGLMAGYLFITEKNLYLKIASATCYVIICVEVMFVSALGTVLAFGAGLVFVIATCLIKYRLSIKSLLSGVVAYCFVVIAVLMNITGQTDVVNDVTQTLPNDITMIATNDENAWQAGTWRWLLWEVTAERIAERPLLGWGPEGIVNHLKVSSTHLQLNGIERTHNEYLQYAAFFGVPALVLYLGGAMTIFIRGLLRRKAITAAELAALAGAFGYLASALVGVSMFYHTPLCFVMLGLGMAGFSAEKSKNNKKAKTEEPQDHRKPLLNVFRSRKGKTEF